MVMAVKEGPAPVARASAAGATIALTAVPAAEAAVHRATVDRAAPVAEVLAVTECRVRPGRAATAVPVELAAAIITALMGAAVAVAAAATTAVEAAAAEAASSVILPEAAAEAAVRPTLSRARVSTQTGEARRARMVTAWSSLVGDAFHGLAKLNFNVPSMFLVTVSSMRPPSIAIRVARVVGQRAPGDRSRSRSRANP